jgi:hypothetical protein
MKKKVEVSLYAILPDFQKRIVFPNVPRFRRLAFWYEQRVDEEKYGALV